MKLISMTNSPTAGRHGHSVGPFNPTRAGVSKQDKHKTAATGFTFYLTFLQKCPKEGSDILQRATMANG